jgi:hypothetical protein
MRRLRIINERNNSRPRGAPIPSHPSAVTIHGGAGKARAWQDHDHRRLYRQGRTLTRAHHCCARRPHRTTPPPLRPHCLVGRAASLSSIAEKHGKKTKREEEKRARTTATTHHHPPPPTCQDGEAVAAAYQQPTMARPSKPACSGRIFPRSIQARRRGRCDGRRTDVTTRVCPN